MPLHTHKPQDVYKTNRGVRGVVGDISAAAATTTLFKNDNQNRQTTLLAAAVFLFVDSGDVLRRRAPASATCRDPFRCRPAWRVKRRAYARTTAHNRALAILHQALAYNLARRFLVCRVLISSNQPFWRLISCCELMRDNRRAVLGAVAGARCHIAAGISAALRRSSARIIFATVATLPRHKPCYMSGER